MCAWTTKSDRFGASGSIKPTAAAHIGPGHYKVDPRQVEHGYAPFGSTDPRATSKEKDSNDLIGKTPDPGAYNPQLPGKYDPGLPRKHVPLGGCATRIDISTSAKPKLDFRPGPGAYQVNQLLGPSEFCRTMGVVPDDKPMLRSSSAPSIPQSHQSYGYEEVGGGRLVRQGPKDPSLFCTGRPGDSAGPGQYQPTHDAIKPRQLNGAFLKGAARTNPYKTEAPGPGHYVAKGSLNVDANTYNCSASFASCADRGPSKREEKRKGDQPGPGQYIPDRQMRPDLREMRSELQYFGSTVERFKGKPTTAVPEHLGPGSYPAPASVKVGPPNVRSFASTQERFKLDDVGSNPGPGPGQYVIAGLTDDNMSGPLATFSMLGNSGGLAFGTMNKRFQSEFQDEGKPGPGHYGAPGGSGIEDADDSAPEELDTKGKSRRKPFKASRLPGSAFASRTPKDVITKGLVKEGAQKPPPGAYDPVLVKDQATVVRLRSKSEGFLSGELRFQGGPLSAPKGYHQNVGPGKYVPQDVTGGKRLGTFNRSMIEGMPEGGRPKGLGFDAQDKRFKLPPSAKLPGPGQYNTDPKWVTKSFNCYFGDLT